MSTADERPPYCRECGRELFMPAASAGEREEFVALRARLDMAERGREQFKAERDEARETAQLLAPWCESHEAGSPDLRDAYARALAYPRRGGT